MVAFIYYGIRLFCILCKDHILYKACCARLQIFFSRSCLCNVYGRTTQTSSSLVQTYSLVGEFDVAPVRLDNMDNLYGSHLCTLQLFHFCR